MSQSILMSIMDNNHQFPLPSTICLSLVTAPFILGTIAVSSLLTTLIELGEASEEIFRGDRLPLLNIPKIEDDD